MDNPPPETKEPTAEPPSPEVLKPRTEDGAVPETPPSGATTGEPPKPAPRRRRAYRPSHRATFIGLTVVAVVLLLNAAVITLVLRSQSKGGILNSDSVTISSSVLDRLGVNRSSVGSSGVELVVGPNARFNGTVKIAGDTDLNGQLKINHQLSAPDANLAKLQAGDTQLSQLNVSGDSTLSKLSLRSDLTVAGATRLQGPVTLNQLLTVNNSLNVAGNLGVGGTLAVGRVSTNNLIISGHVTSTGPTPGVGRGPGIGSNGTVSISGNDRAGTVAINVGAGASGGILASIAFRSQYGATPHVVITPVGAGMANFYVTRSAGGFNIGVSGGPAPGGYAFDYIVEQ